MQAPDSAGGPPWELHAAVLDLLGGEPLAAVAHIKTTRTVERLLDESGQVLAEVCDDRVAAARSGEPTVQRWREWEIELDRGGADLLTAIDIPFTEADAELSNSRSKLSRTLRLRPTTAR
jgi:hypothetical protein